MFDRGGSAVSQSSASGPRWQNILRWFQTRITVEPLLFLYLFGGGLWWPAYDSLMYHKVCLITIDNSTVCGHVEELTEQSENEVQSRMSRWQFYSNLIWDVPPLFLSFICGAVADHRSRKITILLPLIGISCFMGWMIINSVYISMHVGWILLGCLHSGSGGWVSFHIGTYSYISAVSSESQRTSYYAVAEGVVSTAVAISLFISGIVLDNTNYVTVFTIPLALYVIGIFYLVVFLREPKTATKDKSRLDCRKALSGFVCVLRKRPGKGRKLLLILLLCNATFMLASGVHHLNYLHLKHHPLAWSQTMYGCWRGVSSGLGAITIFALVPFLQRRVRIKDTQLLMISFAASGISKIVLGLAVKTWIAFLVPVIDAVHGLGMTCKRSIISKLVEEDEVGQALATLTSIYSVMTLTSSAIFNQLYPYTLHISSGFLFYVSGGLTIVPIILIWWFQVELAKHQEGHLSQEDNTNDDIQNLVASDMLSDEQLVQMESILDMKVTSKKKNSGDIMDNVIL